MRVSHLFARASSVFAAAILGVSLVLSGLIQFGEVEAANGINRQINYQAKLSDSSGFPVADGQYAIKFSLYAAASGGTPLWTASGTTASPNAVTTTLRNGLFTVLLGDTSASGGSQNPLNDLIDWNSDSLYLGVTIGTDSEMTPRKRLASTPYAFNAERLQGMSASGTAFGTSSQFVVNQTSQTAATGTRSALEVRSSGISDANDFLIRGINSSGTAAFQVNRQGNVTTTGYIVSTSTATSTFYGAVSSSRGVFDQSLQVNGQLVCLADGTNCQPASGDSNWAYNASGGLVRLTTSTNDLVLGSTATSTGAPIYADLSGGTAGTSTVYFGHATNTNVVIGGTSTTQSGLNDLFTMNGNDLLVTGNIGSVSSVYTNGAFVAGTNSTYYQDMGIVASGTGFYVIRNHKDWPGPSGAIVMDADAPTQDYITIFSTQGQFVSYVDYTGAYVVGSSTTYGATDITRQYGAFTLNAGSGTYVNDLRSTSYRVERRGSISTSPAITGGGIGAGGTALAVSGRYAFVANRTSSSISVIDVSNPDAPKQVTTTALSAQPRDLTVVGNTLYVAGDSTGAFFTLDISDPARPRLLDSVGAGSLYSVSVQGGYAYTADFGSNFIRVYDVSNPTDILTATSVSVSAPRAVLALGKFLYAVNGSNFFIYDISVPHAPVLMGTYASAGTLESIDIDGRYAYVGRSGATSGLILDIASSTNPYAVGSLDCFPTGCTDVAAHGRFVYTNRTSDGFGFRIFDVLDPTSPQTITFTNPLVSGYMNDVVVSGRYLYALRSFDNVETGTSSLTIVDLGGIEAATLAAHSAEVGKLQVRTDGFVGNHLDVMGSLAVGRGGIQTDGPLSVSATGTTSTIQGALNVFGGLFQGGVRVCLADGTNCQAGGGSDSNWTYVGATGLVRLTTSTNDLVIGSTATSTGAPIYADLSGGTAGTSNIYFGHATNTNVILGGTSTTHPLNAMFTMNGDDFLVTGNIGSVSSVYTNGNFVAGNGTSVNIGGAGMFMTGSQYVYTVTGESAELSNPSHLFVSTDGNQRDVAHFLHQPSGNRTRFAYDGSIYADGYVTSSQGFRVGNVTLGATTLSPSVGSYTISSPSGTIINDIRSRGYNMVKRGAVTFDGSLGGSVDAGKILVSGRNAFIANKTSGTVSIVDIQDPDAPRFVTSTYVVAGAGDEVRNIRTDGKYLYAGTNVGTVRIFDVRAPGQPVFVGSATLTSAGTVTAIEVQGNSLYAILGGGVLETFDVSNRASPVLTSSTTSLVAGRDLVAVGGRLYIGGDDYFSVFSLDNPRAPQLLALLPTPGVSNFYLAAQGSYVYTVDIFTVTSSVYDVSSSTNPFRAAVYSTQGRISLAGRTAYSPALETSRMRIMDVTDPYDIDGSPSSTIQIDATHTVKDVMPQGRYAYVLSAANSTNGPNTLTVVDVGGVDTSNLTADVAQLGWLDVSSDGFISNDLFVGGAISAGQGLSVGGSFSVVASSTSSTAKFVNTASFSDGNQNTGGTEWGAYINSLLVGSKENATGSRDYAMVVNYRSSGGTSDGVCISQDSLFCPYSSSTQVVSLITDRAIVSDGFDLAELYPSSGAVEPGDVLVLDSMASTTVRRAPGVQYDPQLIGVYSTRPAFQLGATGGIPVALTGRVPTKVSAVNGAVSIGDALTSSPFAGYAMKATKPGKILGYALESAAVTSTIEAFVNVGYSGGRTLAVDATGQIAQLQDHLFVAPTTTASAGNPFVGSWALTFRGSAWDGSQAVDRDFAFANEVLSATSARLTLRGPSSSQVFSVDESGNARVSQDLLIGGKLYPSAAGSMQSDKYIFLDTSGGPSSTYMATNADGWQANTSYDFAERYYSPDALEPGDLVVASDRGRLHVQRSLDEKTPLLGIVSTKPAFIAGAPATSTYPIALAGRVPTKVSTMKGAVKIGDPLAPSTIPGIAVKAKESGPIVGYALEAYDGVGIGKIEVFVNPGYWGKPDEPTTPAADANVTVTKSGSGYRGFATITAGMKRVRVTYPSIHSYPNVQVTPRGSVDGGWWTDHYSDVGFDILFRDAQLHDVTFSWRVDVTEDGQTVFFSDGTTAPIDPLTGQAVNGGEPEPVAPPVAPAPAPSAVQPEPVPEEPAVEEETPVVPEPVVVLPTPVEVTTEVPVEPLTPPTEPAP